MYNIIEVKDARYVFFPCSQVILDGSDKVLNLLRDFKEDSNVEELDENQRRILDLYGYEKKLKVNMANALHDYVYSNKVKLSSSQINVENGCNLNCRYCFADGGTHGKSNRMSSETARKVIDFIKENHGESEQLNLSIIGGEPLLNENIFEEIASYSNSVFKFLNNGVRVDTTTNGTLMNDNIKRIFNKYNISYMVSLDSSEKGINDFLRPSKDAKSTYDKILNNYFTNKNKDMCVHVTVTPYNKNISEIAGNLFDLGINKMLFSEVKSDNQEFMFTKKDVEILKKEYEQITEMIIHKINNNEEVVCYPIMNNLKNIHKRQPIKFKCGALSNFVAFDPKGDIYPCDMLMWDKYCIGNIESGIDINKLKDLKKVLADEGNCKACWARYLCGGECLSERMWEDKGQRLIRCEIKRHIYKLRIYLYNCIIKNHKNYNFDLYEFMEG